ncbi:uncharacterized protein LOC135922887 isoform X2 [Gordionus sp. m RMFG-2023]|uniref:uncharacterized protein LOC135922887 isoform X2 n=1 Tax=Gordionus sp. m RMFG-2023 TaxID=3053472 RepID=UPI0031FC7330
MDSNIGILLLFVHSSILYLSAQRIHFPPRIVENPLDITINANEPVTLYCKAEGHPEPMITWYKDEQQLTTSNRNDDSKAVLPNGSLFFLRVTQPDEGYYYCIASNKLGQAKTQPLDSAGKSGPRVVAVNAREDVVLECGLDLPAIRSWVEKSESTPNLKNEKSVWRTVLKLTWKKHNNDDINIKSNNNPTHKLSGSKELKINRDYFHNLPNSEVDDLSSPPHKSISLNHGTSSRLMLNANGNLVITKVNMTDAGYYNCHVDAVKYDQSLQDNPSIRHHNHHKSLKYGISSNYNSNESVDKHFKRSLKYTSIPVNLIVFVKPEFTQTPSDVTAISGDDVEFECSVRGKPDPTVIWKRKGDRAIPDRSLMTEHKSLKILRVESADEGIYACEARNRAGSVQSSATLTVHSRPAFVVAPRDRRVNLNGIATFDCVTTGNPAPSVYWTREGSQVLMFPDRPHGRFSVSADGELKITGVQKEDQGYYVCSALSVAGSSIAKAYLEIIGGMLAHASNNNNGGDEMDREIANPMGFNNPNQNLYLDYFYPPVIGRGPSNQTLAISSVALLPCSVQSNENIIRGNESHVKVTWFKGDKQFIDYDKSRFMILNDGSLKIQDLHISDTGIYTCLVTTWIFLSSVTNYQMTTHSFIPLPFTQTHSQSVKEKKRENAVQLSTSWSAALNVQSPSDPKATFHRIPENFALPGSPGKPHKSHNTNGTTKKSITVAWRSVSEIEHGSSRILGYMIEYFTPSSIDLGWIVAARRILGNEYTLFGLKPSAGYVFLVRAENSYGLGRPSPVSHLLYTLPDDVKVSKEEITAAASLYDLAEVQEKLEASNIINFRDVKPLTSTSIRLEWQVEKNLNYIQGFYLKYRLDPSDFLQTVTPLAFHTVTLMDNTISFHILQDLKKFSNYQFIISPFFDAVEGANSPIVSARTLEDAPSQSPPNVRALINSVDSALIQWESISKTHHNGYLRGYKVHCSFISSDSDNDIHISPHQSDIELIVTNDTARSALITHLNRLGFYRIRVAAFTNVGLGPFSDFVDILYKGPEFGLVVKMTTTPSYPRQSENYDYNKRIDSSGTGPEATILNGSTSTSVAYKRPWIIATAVAALWICVLTLAFWSYRRVRRKYAYQNGANHHRHIGDHGAGGVIAGFQVDQRNKMTGLSSIIDHDDEKFNALVRCRPGSVGDEILQEEPYYYGTAYSRHKDNPSTIGGGIGTGTERRLLSSSSASSNGAVFISNLKNKTHYKSGGTSNDKTGPPPRNILWFSNNNHNVDPPNENVNERWNTQRTTFATNPDTFTNYCALDSNNLNGNNDFATDNLAISPNQNFSSSQTILANNGINLAFKDENYSSNIPTDIFNQAYVNNGSIRQDPLFIGAYGTVNKAAYLAAANQTLNHSNVNNLNQQMISSFYYDIYNGVNANTGGHSDNTSLVGAGGPIYETPQLLPLLNGTSSGPPTALPSNRIILLDYYTANNQNGANVINGSASADAGNNIMISPHNAQFQLINAYGPSAALITQEHPSNLPMKNNENLIGLEHVGARYLYPPSLAPLIYFQQQSQASTAVQQLNQPLYLIGGGPNVGIAEKTANSNKKIPDKRNSLGVFLNDNSQRVAGLNRPNNISQNQFNNSFDHRTNPSDDYSFSMINQNTLPKEPKTPLSSTIIANDDPNKGRKITGANHSLVAVCHLLDDSIEKNSTCNEREEQEENHDQLPDSAAKKRLKKRSKTGANVKENESNSVGEGGRSHSSSHHHNQYHKASKKKKEKEGRDKDKDIIFNDKKQGLTSTLLPNFVNICDVIPPPPLPSVVTTPDNKNDETTWNNKIYSSQYIKD